MEPLVKALEEVGYRNGKNLSEAPYDFRYGLAVDGHPKSASNSNGGKPVILVSHSLGGLYVQGVLKVTCGSCLLQKCFNTKTPLFVTPNVTYSAHDIPEFLKDIGSPEGVLPYTSLLMPITCVIGCGLKTPETLLYGDRDIYSVLARASDGSQHV
ncbi:hypothetical protein R3W88_012024 [Solanum pinnatisectum]|uniref:Uncharacterized protein n=1 Tax=Solanum pinnatisectum TaxID=50273 RepID=A0AAV9L7R3_9SOLN|nr:hypothetical protein R3W88_012024 [Solanum pinnatisectum]